MKNQQVIQQDIENSKQAYAAREKAIFNTAFLYTVDLNVREKAILESGGFQITENLRQHSTLATPEYNDDKEFLGNRYETLLTFLILQVTFTDDDNWTVKETYALIEKLLPKGIDVCHASKADKGVNPGIPVFLALAYLEDTNLLRKLFGRMDLNNLQINFSGNGKRQLFDHLLTSLTPENYKPTQEDKQSFEKNFPHFYSKGAKKWYSDKDVLCFLTARHIIKTTNNLRAGLSTIPSDFLIYHHSDLPEKINDPDCPFGIFMAVFYRKITLAIKSEDEMAVGKAMANFITLKNFPHGTEIWVAQLAGLYYRVHRDAILADESQKVSSLLPSKEDAEVSHVIYQNEASMSTSASSSAPTDFVSVPTSDANSHTGSKTLAVQDNNQGRQILFQSIVKPAAKSTPVAKTAPSKNPAKPADTSEVKGTKKPIGKKK